MGTLADILDVGQAIRMVSPADSVLRAVDEMCRWHVRAVVVGSVADPVGILCERDVLERVVRQGIDPAIANVARVMTSPLVTLPASATPDEALAYMREHRLHQVPILGDEALIGVISATDLRHWAIMARERERDAFESYVMGR